MTDMILAVQTWRMRIPRPFCLQVLPQSMLESFNIRKATDSRDLVFSLLGFLDPSSPHSDLVKPDYSKKSGQVYRDLAQYLIITGGNLCVLNARVIHASIQGHRNIPSWVPNWRALHGPTVPGVGGDIPFCNFVSSLIDFSKNGRVLSAKGFEIDEVTSICQNSFWLLDTQNIHNAGFQDFTNQILHGASVNGETSLSAFLRLYDLLSRKERCLSLSRMERIENAIPLLRSLSRIILNRSGDTHQSFSAITNLVTQYLGQDASVKEKDQLQALIMNSKVECRTTTVRGSIMSTNYAVFRTSRGALGAGPEWTARGDKLCQIAAHSVPFLLRPILGGYRNVGQCIVVDLELAKIAEDLIPRMKVFDIK
ncbi:hypothetical protein OIDMADRAFT_18453 [Oidiodendron maius Zn]|uniref:Uncharacterized protein n=1 Tax=Oidiodendron maius (strain Zn) TaxID=913774 RepID=A0A0C3HK91_OIDMZ|nr:hypothetical protein OIDMADRAFT_18453 [Oidiodendron maius Zn]